MTAVFSDNVKKNVCHFFNGIPEKEASFLVTPLLQNCSNLKHAFTTRLGGISPPPYGSLNLSQKTGDTEFNVKNNIDSVSRQLNITENLFFLEQQHKNEILVIENESRALGNLKFDGVITLLRNKPISIITADCLAILLYDPQRKAIGAVHAGWKGTASGIAEKAINQMNKIFGCKKAEIVVALGSTIGPCCYEVNHIVADSFSQRGEKGVEEWEKASYSTSTNDTELWSLDLVKANMVQLLRAGIKTENISTTPFCTSCREDLFFSHRRDGEKTGRLAAIIMMS